MINAGELADLRADVTSVLQDTCTIRYVSAVTDDSQGGETPTWSDRATNVPCNASIGGLTPQERVIASQIKNTAVWVVTLPAGTVVDTRDQIVVTFASLSGSPTSTLEVVAVAGPRTLEMARRLICVEVK